MKHASPPSKSNMPSHVSVQPITHATLQPAWTETMEGQKQVRCWLDLNVKILHSLSLVDLVKRVRKNVPEAKKLADIEIQQVIHHWAKEYSVSIPAVSAFPEAK